MKIVDYSTLTPAHKAKSISWTEALTAAMLFVVPALLLFVLAS